MRMHIDNRQALVRRSLREHCQLLWGTVMKEEIWCSEDEATFPSFDDSLQLKQSPTFAERDSLYAGLDQVYGKGDIDAARRWELCLPMTLFVSTVHWVA